jgi:hypothetical protein
MGDVFTTNIRGHDIAWKRMVFRRKIALQERKEIEILKKLSHIHMIQLVGTYTHRQHLGILLLPVAVCDLHTFFEDIEAYWTTGTDEVQESRLSQLEYISNPSSPYRASAVYAEIGCLVSAIQ